MKTKKFTLVELIVVLVIIGIVLVMGTLLVVGSIFAWKGYHSVKEDGAKQSIEAIWEGPDRPSIEAEKAPEAVEETSTKQLDIKE